MMLSRSKLNFSAAVVVGLASGALLLTTTLTSPYYIQSCGIHRRHLLESTLVITTLASSSPTIAAAQQEAKKSRTEGYAVQKSNQEWIDQLSPAQFSVLRRGATERQKSSILNTYTSEEEGIYRCAGCNTALFSSATKFSSNTGWPSFASALEVELIGEEVRCETCGGHLGDLFNGGWRFVGTQAARTGKRYCIDGAALIFEPANGGGPKVRGDRPPPAKVIPYESGIVYRN